MIWLSGKRYYDVCPAIKCRDMSSVPPECRQKRFAIGRDGITKCRRCERNICEFEEDGPL